MNTNISKSSVSPEDLQERIIIKIEYKPLSNRTLYKI
jgi:hypothetical protein